MNTREEIDFTEKFICALSIQDIDRIPFANDGFKKGISKLYSYLLGEKEKYPLINELKTLFVKSPFEGDYTRFEKALEFFNDGSRISFMIKNPYYESASIEIPPFIAAKILDEEYFLPKDIIIEAAQAFCDGAKII